MDLHWVGLWTQETLITRFDPTYNLKFIDSGQGLIIVKFGKPIVVIGWLERRYMIFFSLSFIYVQFLIKDKIIK